MIAGDDDLGEALACLRALQHDLPEGTPVILQPESGAAGTGDRYHAFVRGLTERVLGDDEWRTFSPRVLPQLHYLLWGGVAGR